MVFVDNCGELRTSFLTKNYYISYSWRRIRCTEVNPFIFNICRTWVG